MVGLCHKYGYASYNVQPSWRRTLSDTQILSFGACVCVLPGIVVTSLSRVKSSSRVGGWCWRGQFDTAAVSCSSNKIHTWIRPAGQKIQQHTAGVRERGESVKRGTERIKKYKERLMWTKHFTRVVIKLLQDTVHPILGAD